MSYIISLLNFIIINFKKTYLGPLFIGVKKCIYSSWKLTLHYIISEASINYIPTRKTIIKKKKVLGLITNSFLTMLLLYPLPFFLTPLTAIDLTKPNMSYIIIQESTIHNWCLNFCIPKKYFLENKNLNIIPKYIFLKHIRLWKVLSKI